MPKNPSGPKGPWSDDEADYLGDESLYADELARVADLLASDLEARAALLREAPTERTLTEEVKRQMATAAFQGEFSTIRGLEDLLLSLHYARENTKRAV
jgi:hypothetical protein